MGGMSASPGPVEKAGKSSKSMVKKAEALPQDEGALVAVGLTALDVFEYVEKDTSGAEVRVNSVWWKLMGDGECTAGVIDCVLDGDMEAGRMLSAEDPGAGSRSHG